MLKEPVEMYVPTCRKKAGFLSTIQQNYLKFLDHTIKEEATGKWKDH